jgi:predicted AAA+ superfamily ATPase
LQRVKLSFAKGLEIEFIDRERAIKQVYEIGEKGTRYPVIVYGPEGCGKTAWLKQATLILRELGYETLYVNPLHKEIISHVDVKEIIQRFIDTITEATGLVEFKLATLVTLTVRDLLTKWRKRGSALI